MQIYKTFIRSNLEFSSNVWRSSLTKENRQDLERVQKAALKVILRSDYKDYEEALRVTGLQSLDKRREMLVLRFAKKSLNPLRAESVSNFGIFLNFNFPKNTFKYSKSHSQDTSRKIKPVKYHLF